MNIKVNDIMQLEDLFKYNNHWQTKNFIKPNYPFKRKLFNRILEALNSRFIISIEGLRRTGKSVLQRQLIEHLYLTYKSTNNYPLYTFDNENDVDLLPASELEELLKIYFSHILKQHPQAITEKVIIALDEVQNVANWQSVVKSYYDLNENIKFIITGSSSLFLKHSSDSLAGRIIEYELPCLDFEEFLSFTESNYQLSFAKSIDDLEKIIAQPVTPELLSLFETFLLLGGFPDTAKMYAQKIGNKEILSFIRKSIVNKVVKKDLKKYFNVKDTNIDYRLFEICCNDSSFFCEYSNIAREIGLSPVAVKNHIDIFTQSKLIQNLTKFDRKLRREIRSTKKIYVTSSCLMYASLYKNSTEDFGFLGQAAETYAFNKLSSYAPQIYVEKGKGHEQDVDFYIPSEKILIECKYRNRINTEDLLFIEKRGNELNTKTMVFTKQDWTANNNSINIPLMFV